MKLRRLDLLGFKSFRTKTAIEVHDGVTAIVGPNGCGKSNVVDAIRWAIGSQSAKDLRGRAMDDVIFAGSEQHKPLGFAEVSLTLDNDGRDVPVEWKEHPELCVTRRLFRTGDSEYEINGARVRLRDIHQLFLGTGVGAREAYSIIEQGRIGFIVSARPEDRRVLIEEAAGITRYKLQRQTAERRLEKTRENLLRVQDIVSEVERQLGALQRQARRAFQWRELTARLRELEVRGALERRDVAWEQAQAAARLFSETERRATDALGAAARREAEVEELRTTHALNEHALNRATEDAYQARAQRDLLQNSVRHMEREHEEIVERAAGLREREQEARAVVEAAQADARRTQAALEATLAEQAATEAELAERAAALAASRATESETLRVADALTARLAGAMTAIAALSARLDALAAERDALSARREAISEDAGARAAEAEDVGVRAGSAQVVAAEAADARERAARDLEAARLSERDAVASADAHRQGLRDAQATADQSARRRQNLQQALRGGEGYGPGTRAALAAIQAGMLSGVGRPIAESLRVAPEHETRLALALGPALHAFVADDAGAAERLITWASREGHALAVVWGPSAPRELPAWLDAGAPVPEVIARRLAAPEQGAEHHWIGATTRALRLAPPVVIEEPGLAVLVGREADAARAIVRLTRDLDDARRAEADAVAAVGPAREGLESAEGALSAAMAEREGARARFEDAVTRATRAAAAASELVATAARARGAAERLVQEEAALADRIESLAARERADREAHDAQHLRAAELQREQASMMDRLPDVRAAAQRGADEVAEGRAAQARSAERILALRTQRARIDDALRGGSVTLESVAHEAARIGARRAELETLVGGDRSSLAAAADTVAGAESALDRARVRHAATATLLGEHEAEVAGTRRSAAEATAAHRESELMLERARTDLEHAEAALVERHHLTVAAARELTERRPFDDAARRALRDVSELLERLGPVNPGAEEEFADAQQRATFLAAQKEDLEQALRDLDAAIRKMDKTSRDLFRETFDAVNERFQLLFPRIFRGGRAELQLTAPDDLLATGVEIVVQPPGKRLQSMTLLSGGEKALTAVALVFSIFQLKPTPFCILDEVDAPLDEANVTRFARMVQEMATDTQFLIITHNKRTMEVAGTLYGVTMEEPGVSKVVGVLMSAGDARQRQMDT